MGPPPQKVRKTKQLPVCAEDVLWPRPYLLLVFNTDTDTYEVLGAFMLHNVEWVTEVTSTNDEDDLANFWNDSMDIRSLGRTVDSPLGIQYNAYIGIGLLWWWWCVTCVCWTIPQANCLLP